MKPVNIGLIGKFYSGMHALAAGLIDGCPNARPIALGSGNVAGAMNPARMDAYVFLHDEGYEELDTLLATGATLLSRVDRGADRGVHCLMIDDASAAQHLARHLVEQGATKLYFTGVEAPFCTRRAEAVQAVAQEESIPFARMDDAEALLQALTQESAPVGLLAMNDNMAHRHIHRLREAGVHVPNGVLVAGFDNAPLGAQPDAIPLTTCALPDREQGLAMGQLIAKAQNEKLQKGVIEFIPVTAHYYRASSNNNEDHTPA